MGRLVRVLGFFLLIRWLGLVRCLVGMVGVRGLRVRSLLLLRIIRGFRVGCMRRARILRIRGLLDAFKVRRLVVSRLLHWLLVSRRLPDHWLWLLRGDSF